MMQDKTINNKYKNKGAVTIYICLVLVFLIPIFLMILGLARYNAMQVQVECAADMSTDSVLAEYHRELLDDFGLLFVDTAYGGSYGSLDKTLEHLEEYLDFNLNPDKNLLLFGSRDLFDLQVVTSEITEVSRATDEDGAVFRYMVQSYMLDKYGLSYIDKIKDFVSVAEKQKYDDIDIKKDNEEAQKQLVNFDPAEEKGTDFSDVKVEDPVSSVSNLRKLGILTLVCSDEVSVKKIEKNTYASKRDLIKGDGMRDNWKSRNALEDTLLFNEYVMQECGNYQKKKDGSRLDYQAEYVVCGKDNDTDNLTGVANRLLLIRGAANTIYFLTDTVKQNEVRAVAEGIAAACMIPEFYMIFEVAIDAAWIYAESVYDVRLLFNGEAVPLITTEKDWNLSLESIMDDPESAITNMSGTEEEYSDEPGDMLNMKYADYLRLLLYSTFKRDITFRMMDIVEMDIREKTGKESFRLDECVAGYTVQIGIVSRYGYEYLYERSFGYE